MTKGGKAKTDRLTERERETERERDRQRDRQRERQRDRERDREREEEREKKGFCVVFFLVLNHGKIFLDGSDSSISIVTLNSI